MLIPALHYQTQASNIALSSTPMMQMTYKLFVRAAVLVLAGPPAKAQIDSGTFTPVPDSELSIQ